MFGSWSLSGVAGLARSGLSAIEDRTEVGASMFRVSAHYQMTWAVSRGY